MSQFDVLCIGNAIVDIIARCEDDFLVANGIHKGAMNLIDAERAEALYAAMGPAVEMSGGSAGNTAAGIASLGGSAAYFGLIDEIFLFKTKHIHGHLTADQAYIHVNTGFPQFGDSRYAFVFEHLLHQAGSHRFETRNVSHE